MLNNIKPCIIFHIFDDVKSNFKYFSVELEFIGKRNIILNKKLIIDEKYFPKSKDRFKTNIYLNVNLKRYKFAITLYYDENHLSILKSSKIGIAYEIINIFPMENMQPLDKIDFISENNCKISAAYFDTIGNRNKRRFLLVNFPINMNLNINNLNKMKKNESYQINILPNNTIIQEIKKPSPAKKIKLNNINQMKNIVKEIQEFIKSNMEDIDMIDNDKRNKIISDLGPFDDYFNQNLINKEENDWNSDEFTFYYYYFQFKLFLNYSSMYESRKILYYRSAIDVYKNIFEELKNISNVTVYQKICAITSLYARLRIDCIHKENKSHVIGQYKLINMKDNKIKCYNLVYEFINKIIDNLKEDSLIYLPLLQVNSGFNKDIIPMTKKIYSHYQC